MRNGDMVFVKLPRFGVVRVTVINHLIHYRGQLSVYLRMLNVPVPGIYGPSADEKMRQLAQHQRTRSPEGATLLPIS
jgi:hypothetical protein